MKQHTEMDFITENTFKLQGQTIASEAKLR